MSCSVFETRAESPLRQPIHRSTAVQGLSPAHAGYFQRQDRGLNLQPAGLTIAVIDGPFDATALSKILARTPVSVANGTCRTDANGACSHGTFIMGVIGASRDAPIPGLCPECQLVHVQLFVDEEVPHASIAQLADAITVAVAAGAKLINLSLAIQGEDAAGDHALARALDRAEARDTVIMVAAGNDGRHASGQLLSHPVTIPVVAIDATHQLLPDCNSGPTPGNYAVELRQETFAIERGREWPAPWGQTGHGSAHLLACGVPALRPQPRQRAGRDRRGDACS